MKLKDWMKANRYTDVAFISEINKILMIHGRATYTWRSVKSWRDGSSIPRPQAIEAIHELTKGKVRYEDHILTNDAYNPRKTPLKGSCA